MLWSASIHVAYNYCLVFQVHAPIFKGRETAIWRSFFSTAPKRKYLQWYKTRNGTNDLICDLTSSAQGTVPHNILAYVLISKNKKVEMKITSKILKREYYIRKHLSNSKWAACNRRWFHMLVLKMNNKQFYSNLLLPLEIINIGDNLIMAQKELITYWRQYKVIQLGGLNNKVWENSYHIPYKNENCSLCSLSVA